MNRPCLLFSLLVAVSLCGAGCESIPEFTSQPASSSSGTGGTGNLQPSINLTGGTDGLPSGGAESETSPCDNCPQYSHCERDENGNERCAPNTCDDLTCEPNEECVVTELGALCESLACTRDIDCASNRFCDRGEGICKDDVCTPGNRSCSPTGESGQTGNTVYVCASNGGSYFAEVTCGSAATFTSACAEVNVGTAGCSCEDDWDCPGFQECEAGSCQGSKDPPTCKLPPESFADMLPQIELEWGGASETNVAAYDATGAQSPFAESGQVVLSPLVANLTDDNGDGLIDERDFPEIIFNTFCDSAGTTANGTLRAIHGGGPNKGADYFANCAGNHWIEGDDPSTASCTCSEADLDSTANPAVGDLNGDGIPEIVTIVEISDNGSNWGKSNGFIRIYDNRGVQIRTSAEYNLGSQNPAPSLANVDHFGNVEIVVGRHVFFVDNDLNFTDHFSGNDSNGSNGQGPISCVADLDPTSPGNEIIAGESVYGLPAPENGELSQADCAGGDTSNYCQGNLILLHNGSNGFCAVADVWGADQSSPPGPSNPLDGTPELVVIRSGNMRVFADDNSRSGFQMIQLGSTLGIPGGNGGGTPNIDDFDGDGFPEIGTAGQTGYVLMDLQMATADGLECPAWTSVGDDNTNKPRLIPTTSCTLDADCGDTSKFACNESKSHESGSGGTCVCLHNGWRRTTQDASSRVTGSSVFDFNGDGAAEVVYNDECFFRIYDGSDGSEHLRIDSESRTRTEYPIVADVDNDGNAEIIFGVSNESGFCGAGPTVDPLAVYNNGIEVWGDTADRWVSARRIWNQHAYHVTNVLESGGIPVVEPNSWQPLGSRIYNTYRSQPRSFGSAPDLVVDGLQVIAPGSCGASTALIIGAQIRNIGDLRVSDIPVAFEGTWDGAGVTEVLADSMGDPLEVLVTQSLEPDASIVLQLSYESGNNARGTFPDSVRVIVDPDEVGDGVARECNENNNTATEDVNASPPLPDLRLALNNPNGMCPPPISGTVFNETNVAASSVVVRIFAGDPAGGARAIGDIQIGDVPAGGSIMFEESLSGVPTGASILFYGEVDPDDTVTECNDNNNIDGPTTSSNCFTAN